MTLENAHADASEMAEHELVERVLELRRAGRHEEAAGCLLDAVPTGPDSGDVLFITAALLMERGHLQTAGHLLERALELDPDNSQYYANLGEVYRRLGQMAKAATTLASAIGLDPELPQPHINLGLTLQGGGELRAAASCFARAQTAGYDLSGVTGLAGAPSPRDSYPSNGGAKPQDDDLLTLSELVADTLRRFGQLSEAATFYQHALEIAPRSCGARHGLALVMLQMLRVDEGLEYLKRVVELAEDADRKGTRPQSAEEGGALPGAYRPRISPALIATYKQAIAAYAERTPAGRVSSPQPAPGSATELVAPAEASEQLRHRIAELEASAAGASKPHPYCSAQYAQAFEEDGAEPL